MWSPPCGRLGFSGVVVRPGANRRATRAAASGCGRSRSTSTRPASRHRQNRAAASPGAAKILAAFLRQHHLRELPGRGLAAGGLCGGEVGLGLLGHRVGASLIGGGEFGRKLPGRAAPGSGFALGALLLGQRESALQSLASLSGGLLGSAVALGG
jgi:hypothetical protein